MKISSGGFLETPRDAQRFLKISWFLINTEEEEEEEEVLRKPKELSLGPELQLHFKKSEII